MSELNDRKTWIDSLKGIAILGVILLHTAGNSLPESIDRFVHVGSNGVQLFFILSAYLAFSSYAKLNDKHSLKINAIWIGKKIIRIIPMYYLMLIVHIVLGGQSWALGEEGITFGNVATHSLLLHGFSPYYINSIIGVEWYIANLVIFWCIVPLLYKWIDSLKKSIIALICSIFICSNLIQVVSGVVPQTELWQNYIDSYWFFAQFPVMVTGILLFYMVNKKKYEGTVEDKLLALALIFVTVYMVKGQIYGDNHLAGTTRYSLWGIWFLLLIYSQHIYNFSLIDNKFFAFLGKNSYSFYIVHMFVIWLYGSLVNNSLQNVVLNLAIKYIVVVIITVVVGLLVSQFVDEPVKRYIDSKLK